MFPRGSDAGRRQGACHAVRRRYNRMWILSAQTLGVNPHDRVWRICFFSFLVCQAVMTGLILFAWVQPASEQGSLMGAAPQGQLLDQRDSLQSKALRDAARRVCPEWLDCTDILTAPRDLFWDRKRILPVRTAVGLPSANHPLARTRPKSAFGTLPVTNAEPLITLFTITNDPQQSLWETASSVRGQSLQAFEWVIVDDHSSKGASKELLRKLQTLDERIQVLRVESQSSSEGRRVGTVAARNFALEWVRGRPSRYFAFLGDDDLLELTALEKCVLVLESTPPEIASASVYTAVFQSATEDSTVFNTYVWRRGWSSGRALLETNTIGFGVVEKTAWEKSQCRFTAVGTGREPFIDPEWSLWLCLSATGKLWGITVPEVLHWYRSASHKWSVAPLFLSAQPGVTRTRQLLQELSGEESIRKVYAKSLDGVGIFNLKAPRPYPRVLEVDRPIIRNRLAAWPRSLLLLIPSFNNSALGRSAVQAVKYMTTVAKWRVTIVAISGGSFASLKHRPRGEDDLHIGVGGGLLPQFMRFSHDVFTMTELMPDVEWTRFLVYIMRSRSVSVALFTGDQYFYEVLPTLREHAPESTRFVDLVLPRCKRAPSSPRFDVMSATYGQFLHMSLAHGETTRSGLEKLRLGGGSVHIAPWGVSIATDPATVPEARLRDESTMTAVALHAHHQWFSTRSALSGAPSFLVYVPRHDPHCALTALEVIRSLFADNPGAHRMSVDLISEVDLSKSVNAHIALLPFPVRVHISPRGWDVPSLWHKLSKRKLQWHAMIYPNSVESPVSLEVVAKGLSLGLPVLTMAHEGVTSIFKDATMQSPFSGRPMVQVSECLELVHAHGVQTHARTQRWNDGRKGSTSHLHTDHGLTEPFSLALGKLIVDDARLRELATNARTCAQLFSSTRLMPRVHELLERSASSANWHYRSFADRLFEIGEELNTATKRQIARLQGKELDALKASKGRERRQQHLHQKQFVSLDFASEVALEALRGRSQHGPRVHEIQRILHDADSVHFTRMSKILAKQRMQAPSESKSKHHKEKMHILHRRAPVRRWWWAE